MAARIWHSGLFSFRITHEGDNLDICRIFDRTDIGREADQLHIPN